MNEPLPDVFAELLGAQVERVADGCAQARLVVAAGHLNPHGTAHGAVVYSLAVCALAAAANDRARSGIARSVLIDYLAPAALGERLVAVARVLESTGSEDVFEVRVLCEAAERLADNHRAGEGVADEHVVARLSARVTRRTR
jgi:acyl-CoA thioesterase